jgi:FtsH-binding integral membrane protein
MNDFNRGYARSIPADRADMSVDAGLRSFMLGVYNKVALGLLLSAGLAFLTSAYTPVASLLYVLTPDGRLAGFTMLGTIVRFAPLAMMLVAMFAMKNPTAVRRARCTGRWSPRSAPARACGCWPIPAPRWPRPS